MVADTQTNEETGGIPFKKEYLYTKCFLVWVTLNNIPEKNIIVRQHVIVSEVMGKIMFPLLLW